MKGNKVLSSLKGNRLINICKSSSSSNSNIQLGNKLSRYSFSTAFDPFFHLHHQTVTRDQQEAFREVWENDIGDFKKDLTKAELESLQKKVDETASIDEFEGLLKGLWGPDRHAWIRETATFQYANETVMNGIKNSENPRETGLSLILGDDETFNKFRDSTGLLTNDSEGYLSDFIYADLRYLCSAIAFDYFEGPKITLAFGCRKQYHYELPNPIGRSAYWMNCIYDRCHPGHLVFLCAVHALKDGKPISTAYYQELLDSLEHNAFKEEEWRPYAQACAAWDKKFFYDDFDRAFNTFQTDPGVSKLEIRYASDWDRFRF